MSSRAEREAAKIPRDPINVLTSMACLAAAYGVQRGEVLDVKAMDGGDQMSPEEKAVFLEVVESTRQALLTATPDELACAIAMYTAHLRQCGYNVLAGYDQ